MANDIAQSAYEAYCQERGWKSFDGNPLPPFREQSPELQSAWGKAAEAAVEGEAARHSWTWREALETSDRFKEECAEAQNECRKAQAFSHSLLSALKSAPVFAGQTNREWFGVSTNAAEAR